MTLVELIRELNQAHEIDPVAGNHSNEVAKWLHVAKSHLATANAILETDPSMALEAVQQACRKSLVAHLLAAGYRVAGQNKHSLMVRYGRTALAGDFSDVELDGLNIIRQLRNAADYDNPTPLDTNVLRALVEFGQRIHDACVANLPKARINVR